MDELINLSDSQPRANYLAFEELSGAPLRTRFFFGASEIHYNGSGAIQRPGSWLDGEGVDADPGNLRIR